MYKQLYLLLCFSLFSTQAYSLKEKKAKQEQISSYNITSLSTFSVKFLAKITPVGSFEGTASKLSGYCQLDLAKNKIKKCQFKVPVASLSTENETRDKHMREKYLEMSKGYTDIELMIPEQNYEISNKKENQEAQISGVWKIHGKEKKVTLLTKKIKFPQKNEKKRISVEIESDLDVTDFGIKQPSQLVFVKMHKVIKLTLKIELLKKDTVKNISKKEK